MTKEELLNLSAKLPKTSKQKLADDFGLSIGYVRQILTGAKERDDVVIAAVEILAENERKKKAARETLQRINEEVA